MRYGRWSSETRTEHPSFSANLLLLTIRNWPSYGFGATSDRGAFRWQSGRATWPRLRTEVHAAALSEQVVIYANVPAVATSIEAVADEKADEKARLKKAEKGCAT